MATTHLDAAINLLPTIKPSGLAVYAFLCRCADEMGVSSPKQKDIETATGISDRYVRTVLKLLESVGLIHAEKTGRGTSYTVIGNRNPIPEPNTGTQYRNTVPLWNHVPVLEPKSEEAHLVSDQNPPPIIPPSQQEEEVEPYLRAKRTWNAWFGDSLMTVHGGRPNGEVKQAYLDDLEAWERIGKRPTPEQLTEAMADALRWWRQQGNTGRPHKATLVLKRLRELVNPLAPLEAASATETFTETPHPTPEQYSARLAANSAKIATLQAEFQARQKGLVA